MTPYDASATTTVAEPDASSLAVEVLLASLRGLPVLRPDYAEDGFCGFLPVCDPPFARKPLDNACLDIPLLPPPAPLIIAVDPGARDGDSMVVMERSPTGRLRWWQPEHQWIKRTDRNLGGVPIVISDLLPRSKVWVRPRVPSRAEGRRGTRREWKRQHPPGWQRIGEPETYLLDQRLLAMTSAKYAELERRVLLNLANVYPGDIPL